MWNPGGFGESYSAAVPNVPCRLVISQGRGTV